ncbi:hypothetical protein K3495_g9345 [Podosphaera aphanis]|nr:hypothetical protein K3495_g9345 [Podosphaera aphanis]
MANNELHKWVTSDVDFYDLLGIHIEACSDAELRRAYRKTALKYHPDKAGKDFDPAKYELFQAAHEVLSDPSLKAQYDQHRQAKVHRQRANELFEGRRKQMKDDLEAREKGITVGSKRPRDDESQKEILQKFQRLAEEGKKKRLARAAMMAKESLKCTSPNPSHTTSTPATQHAESSEKKGEDKDEISYLEREIQEAKD